LKSITVKQLQEKFSLEILAGEDNLERAITRSRAHRPGLEFVGYFDFFPMNRVQVLGRKEINYLHKQTEEERRLHTPQRREVSPSLFYRYR